jgi:hypothetical protein
MDLYCARGGAENSIGEQFELFAEGASSAVTTSSIFLDGLADLVSHRWHTCSLSAACAGDFTNEST